MVCWVLTLGACGYGAQAQTIYKSVGPDGRVTFSDRPPSSLSQTARVDSGADRNLANATLPYALAQIVASYPVTLYSANDCAPCDEGRSLLRARGVPFTEKTVNRTEDVEALKRLSDSSALPVLTIGGQQLKGFAAADWQQYLSLAGYPTSSNLPTNYRQPPAQPLVAIQTAPSPTAQASAPSPTRPEPAPPSPRAANTNPAGIQF